MNHPNKTEPIVPPLRSDPTLKSYICPYCQRFLFKGNVKNVRMECPHCQKMIHANADELEKDRIQSADGAFSDTLSSSLSDEAPE